MINVTQTFFPPIEDYFLQTKKIWKNNWLTNRGELVLELESKLKEYLGLSNIILTTNGTLPIQIALKTLPPGSEVITTPFSYVATTSSIVWEGFKPVFVDITHDFLTIDETKIEDAITPLTSAILATHVFGNPCNVEIIEKIALKHNLRVIYDAAHCFGVNYKGSSIFNYGDINTCSFHATKVFHTGEGGALICNSENLFKNLYYSHNFGHLNPTEFYGLGINAKMSELQGAMGLSVLPYMSKILADRKNIVEIYTDNLSFSNYRAITLREGTTWNYSYYPIIFESEELLLQTQNRLNENNIFPRRYFYPSLNTLSYVEKKEMPISESISSRILCLPLYQGLANKDAFNIVKLIDQ